MTRHQIRRGRMKSNWVAPCKPARCDCFVAIFQVAQSRLKFGMTTLFVLKNDPVFFFSRMQKKMDEIAWNSTPTPSLCVRLQTTYDFILESQNTVRVFYAIGGERGKTFKNVYEALFPRLWKKKKQGQFYHRKGVGMPNLSGFWATWKIATKSSYRAGLHGALQLLFHFTRDRQEEEHYVAISSSEQFPGSAKNRHRNQINLIPDWMRMRTSVSEPIDAAQNSHMTVNLTLSFLESSERHGVDVVH